MTFVRVSSRNEAYVSDHGGNQKLEKLRQGGQWQWGATESGGNYERRKLLSALSIITYPMLPQNGEIAFIKKPPYWAAHVGTRQVYDGSKKKKPCNTM